MNDGRLLNDVEKRSQDGCATTRTAWPEPHRWDKVVKPSGLPAERPDILTYTAAVEDIDTVAEYLIGSAETVRYRKHDIYRYVFACCDIETTTVPAGSLWNETEYPMSFPYLIQYRLCGVNFLFRDGETFGVFLARLERHLAGAGHTLVVYVHNLSYEYQFFRGFVPIDFKSVFALQSRRVGFFYSNSDTLEWRCSYLLSNMSLEKFTENYCDAANRKDKELIDYEVVRYPWDDLTDEIIYYGLMDVITLEAAVAELMKREGDDLKTIPMTNTGYVRRSCRLACIGENWKHYQTEEEKRTYRKYRNYRKGFEKMRLTLQTYNLLRDAFRGGNTHSNRFLSGRILPDPEDEQRIGHVDFTSEYPAQLICADEFPMGRLMDCTADIKGPADIDFYCKNYWLIIKIAMVNPRLARPYKTKCPYIPLAKCDRQHGKDGVYDNGRLMSQDGIVFYTFLGCEWDVIKRQYAGTSFVVVEAWYTTKGCLPDLLRGVVREWFEKKTTLKGVEGSEYEYMKSKNRVNACYGMIVEQIIKDIMTVSDTGFIDSRRPTPEEAGQQMESFYSFRNVKFLPYQWGVTITALARVEHMRLIEMFGDDFIYGDTDSVFYLNPSKYDSKIEDYNNKWITYASQCGMPISATTKKGVVSTLGVADMEPYVDRFKTLGAKKYAMEENGKLSITVAGVPKKAGASLLGRLENFRPGFKFYIGDEDSLEDRQTWKKTLHYRDDLKGSVEIDGHTLKLGPCIAMTRAPYVLDITDEYSELTGIGREEIYEQDDVW